MLQKNYSTTIQNVSRRSCRAKEVEDIICVFKNIAPTFVVKELRKLPPFNTRRCLKIIKRQQQQQHSLQSEVKTIKESCNTVDDIKDVKSEAHNMKYVFLIEQSVLNMNIIRGGCLLVNRG